MDHLNSLGEEERQAVFLYARMDEVMCAFNRLPEEARLELNICSECVLMKRNVQVRDWEEQPTCAECNPPKIKPAK